jgi:quaternary ammonium compound-resistance protein SugE
LSPDNVNAASLGHCGSRVALSVFFFEEELMMTWIYLVIAGIFEVVWATMMKLSNGFSHLGYAAATVVGMILSFGFLALATKHLPLSIAYPIWTGIGAVGAIIVGLVFFKDTIAPITWVFIAMLVIGIIGIKVTS